MGLLSVLSYETLDTGGRAKYFYKIAWAVYDVKEERVLDLRQETFCPFMFVLENKKTTVDICRRAQPFLVSGVREINRLYLASSVLIVYPSKADFLACLQNEYRRVGKRGRKLITSLRLMGANRYFEPGELQSNLVKFKEKKNAEELFKELGLSEEEVDDIYLPLLLVLREIKTAMPQPLIHLLQTIRKDTEELLLPFLSESEVRKLLEAKEKYVRRAVPLLSYIPVSEKLEGESEEKEKKVESPEAGNNYSQPKEPQPEKEKPEIKIKKEEVEKEGTGRTKEEEKGEALYDLHRALREEERKTPAPAIAIGSRIDIEERRYAKRGEPVIKPVKEEVKEEVSETAETQVNLIEAGQALLLGFLLFSFYRGSPLSPSSLFFRTFPKVPLGYSAYLDSLDYLDGLLAFLNSDKAGAVSEMVSTTKNLIRKTSPIKLDIPSSDIPMPCFRSPKEISSIYGSYLSKLRKSPKNFYLKCGVFYLKVLISFLNKKKVDAERLAEIMLGAKLKEGKALTLFLKDYALGLKKELSESFKKASVSPHDALSFMLRDVFPFSQEDESATFSLPENYLKRYLKLSRSISRREDAVKFLHGDSNHFRAYLKMLLSEEGEDRLKLPAEYILKSLSHRFRDRLIIPSLLI